MTTETPLIDAYVEWLHTLTALSAHRVSRLLDAQVRIRTPEAEGVGPEAVKTMYAGLFEDAASVTIRVISRAQDTERKTVYLRWDRLITSKAGGKQTLSGITEMMLGLDGKIVSLIEYWDSVPDVLPQRGFFQKLFGK